MSVEFAEGIEYLKKYIGDVSIYVLGKMVKCYENSNIDTLRNIIFYDLDNYQTYHDIKTKKHNTTKKYNLIMSEKNNNNCVIFDDHISKRIWIDIDTYTVIDLLFKLTKDIINKKELFDIIIYEWLYKEIEKSKKGYDMNIDPNNSKYILDQSNMKYLFLNIKDDLWNNFTRIAKIRNLNLGKAFKIAIINFLENRYSYLESGNEIKLIDTNLIDQIKFDIKMKYLIIENIILEKREIKDIQEICGVYLFFTVSGRGYVGSSINIRERLLNHIKSRYHDIIESIYIYKTEDIFDAVELEKEMIKNLMPELNKIDK